MSDHYSTIANRYSTLVDESLILRDRSATPIGATTSEVGLEFPVRAQSLEIRIIWGPYEDFVAGTSSWAIEVQVSDLLGGVYATVSPNVELKDKGGAINLAIHPSLVEYINNNAAFVRVMATKTGTPGDLSYGAFITCGG